jgi:hypothetical protein
MNAFDWVIVGLVAAGAIAYGVLALFANAMRD